MRAYIYLYAAIAVLVRTGAQAESAVRWERESQQIAVRSGQKSAELTFVGKNTGQKPVALIQVKPGCECMSVGYDDQAIPPGGEIRLRVLIMPGQTTQPTTKNLLVYTSEGSPMPQVLSVTLVPEDVVTVAPKFLTWQVGGERNAQVSKVKMTSNSQRIESLKSLYGAFEVSFQQGTGRDVLVNVTPKTTVTPAQDTIFLTITDGADQTTLVMYATVRTDPARPDSADAR